MEPSSLESIGSTGSVCPPRGFRLLSALGSTRAQLFTLSEVFCLEFVDTKDLSPCGVTTRIETQVAWDHDEGPKRRNRSCEFQNQGFVAFHAVEIPLVAEGVERHLGALTVVQNLFVEVTSEVALLDLRATKDALGTRGQGESWFETVPLLGQSSASGHFVSTLVKLRGCFCLGPVIAGDDLSFKLEHCFDDLGVWGACEGVYSCKYERRRGNSFAEFAG